jgi:hypothetical protein
MGDAMALRVLVQDKDAGRSAASTRMGSGGGRAAEEGLTLLADAILPLGALVASSVQQQQWRGGLAGGGRSPLLELDGWLPLSSRVGTGSGNGGGRTGRRGTEESVAVGLASMGLVPKVAADCPAVRLQLRVERVPTQQQQQQQQQRRQQQGNGTTAAAAGRRGSAAGSTANAPPLPPRRPSRGPDADAAPLLPPRAIAAAAAAAAPRPTPSKDKQMGGVGGRADRHRRERAV